MAELLVVNRDSTGGPSSYVRGDVVVVVPDGHQWGRLEDPETRPERLRELDLEGDPASPPDKFIIIQVPDRPWDEIRWLGEPEVEAQPVRPDLPKSEVLTAVVHKSRFQVQLLDLPAAAQTALSRVGRAQRPWAQIRAAVRDRRDGTLLTGHDGRGRPGPPINNLR